MRIIGEAEFRSALFEKLMDLPGIDSIGSVTGPGRSGAVAAVYASHMIGVPFIPFKQRPPERLGNVLIVDTAMESGVTMRKAIRWYERLCKVQSLVVYHEPPRVAFWYEAQKPQFYRHELRKVANE